MAHPTMGRHGLRGPSRSRRGHRGGIRLRRTRTGCAGTGPTTIRRLRLSLRLRLVQSMVRRRARRHPLPDGAHPDREPVRRPGRDVIDVVATHPRARGRLGAPGRARSRPWWPSPGTVPRPPGWRAGCGWSRVTHRCAAGTGRRAGRPGARVRRVRQRQPRRTSRPPSRRCRGSVGRWSDVIWTRHRRPPDATPSIRADFAAAGFTEVAFEAPERLRDRRGPPPARAGPRRLRPRSDALRLRRRRPPPGVSADDHGPEAGPARMA